MNYVEENNIKKQMKNTPTRISGSQCKCAKVGL